MNLYGGLGYSHLARNGLVGIALYQAAQDGLLPSRQRWRVAAADLWYMFDRSKLGPRQFSIVTTIINIVVIRVSIVSAIFVCCVAADCASVNAAVLLIRDETQNFWR